MNTRTRMTMLCAASLVAACGGAVSWNTACGCVPATIGLAEDLGIDDPAQFTLTPAVLKDKVEDRLSAQPMDVNLKTVRSLGYAFDQNCHERPNLRIRCTFWLWYADGMNRGIELNLRESGSKHGLELRAHYVYEAQER